MTKKEMLERLFKMVRDLADEVRVMHILFNAERRPPIGKLTLEERVLELEAKFDLLEKEKGSVDKS